MSDQKLLELTPVAFTDKLLDIKVKNISGASLDKTLVIELYPPIFLVNEKIRNAAKEAPANMQPEGAKSLAGIVTVPEGWSVWARREASDSTAIIAVFNDMDQKSGAILELPVKFPAGAEFTIHIPLNPDANRDNINLLYNYQHGSTEEDQTKPVYGKLELKGETSEWIPDVTLNTNHSSPTAIAPGSLVRVFWKITDGVSATLRGPLPGGNTELTLSSSKDADFRIADGFIEVRVGGPMTYLLQAEVKRPGKPNAHVARMLWLDTTNNKYCYIFTRPTKVLPHGLIEVDWAAWGVKQVTLSVGSHTTRNIRLTQQTVGRSYEGSGVLRVSATKAKGESELVHIEAPAHPGDTKTVTVVSWIHMDKPNVSGQPLGLAMGLPMGAKSLAALTSEGLFICDVGDVDPENMMKQLIFHPVITSAPAQWLAVTALNDRFVCLRRTSQDDLEVASYTADRKEDVIPPLTLPADLRPLLRGAVVFDFVGFGGRAYTVVEASSPDADTVRRAFSVSFDSNARKAEYRPEPLLERLPGYKLVTFDNALYALHRGTGRMFRFDLTAGQLGEPIQAASAVRKGDDTGGREQSMIRQGLIVPVGRVLLVLSPSAVPSFAELEAFGLHNVLRYTIGKAPNTNPNTIPQDLVYNPQKNYWARCGHDLDVTRGVAAFRDGDSPRLWVIQPDLETHTLAVGSENLFANDYVLDFPTKPLPPYLNKTRQFNIMSSNTSFSMLKETYRKANLHDFSSDGPVQLLSKLPDRPTSSFTVDFKYNEADPAPITLRFLANVFTSRDRNDCDYILEVTFTGPDLSSITSSFRRIGFDAQGRLFNQEVFESQVKHPTGSVINVVRPRHIDRFTIPFVIANTANVDVKNVGLDVGFSLLSPGTKTSVALDYRVPDFSLIFDPRKEANGGELRVNLNFAMPPGVEASSGSKPQTKRIRLDTDKSKLMHVAFVGLLKPDDAALALPGMSEPIRPMSDRLVYVCQISRKP